MGDNNEGNKRERERKARSHSQRAQHMREKHTSSVTRKGCRTNKHLPSLPKIYQPTKYTYPPHKSFCRRRRSTTYYSSPRCYVSCPICYPMIQWTVVDLLHLVLPRRFAAATTTETTIESRIDMAAVQPTGGDGSRRSCCCRCYCCCCCCWY